MSNGLVALGSSAAFAAWLRCAWAFLLNPLLGRPASQSLFGLTQRIIDDVHSYWLQRSTALLPSRRCWPMLSFLPGHLLGNDEHALGPAASELSAQERLRT
jgi:hypothetical protein